MKTSLRKRLRDKRKQRVKNRVQGNPQKLRLSVFKSAKHIYAQIIDDQAGKTVVASSSVAPDFREQLKNGGNVQAAALVGQLLGAKAVDKGIREVYYDRNGFIYTGRVKALADAVREKGVKF